MALFYLPLRVLSQKLTFFPPKIQFLFFDCEFHGISCLFPIFPEYRYPSVADLIVIPQPGLAPLSPSQRYIADLSPSSFDSPNLASVNILRKHFGAEVASFLSTQLGETIHDLSS